MTEYNTGGFGGKIDWATEVASQTAGDLPHYDSSGNPSLLSAGNEGDVLAIDSNGVPAWTGGSGLVKLGETTQASSGGTLAVSSLTTTAYKQLVIVAHVNPSGSSAALEMTFNSDTGTNYDYSYLDAGTATSATNQANADLTGSFGTNYGMYVITVNNESSKEKGFSGYGGDASTVNNFNGRWDNTASTITSVELAFTNIDAGSRLEVFGLT